MGFQVISRNSNSFNPPASPTVTSRNLGAEMWINTTVSAETFDKRVKTHPEITSIHTGWLGKKTLISHAIYTGNTALVEHLVKIKGPQILNQANLMGQTPLHQRIDYGVLKQLIALKADVNVMAHVDPLSLDDWAIQNGENPDYLDCDSRDYTVLESQLIGEDQNGPSPNNVIKLLLAHGACIQQPNPLLGRVEKENLAAICKEFSEEINSLCTITQTLEQQNLYAVIQQLIFEYAITPNDAHAEALIYIQICASKGIRASGDNFKVTYQSRWQKVRDKACPHLTPEKIEKILSKQSLLNICLMYNATDPLVKRLLTQGALLQPRAYLSTEKPPRHIEERLNMLTIEFSEEITKISSIAKRLTKSALLPSEVQLIILDYTCTEERYALICFKRNKREQDKRSSRVVTTFTPDVPNHVLETICNYTIPRAQESFQGE